MLNIYTYMPNNIERDNEYFFAANTSNILVKEPMDSEKRKLFCTSEGSDGFCDSLTFKSKFFNAGLMLSGASTGTKTLMNILYYPDIVFSVEECGSNVLAIIYGLDNGNIYSYFKPTTFNADAAFNRQFKVFLSDGSSHICDGLREVGEYYDR